MGILRIVRKEQLGEAAGVWHC